MSLDYQAVEFGSHHWLAADEHGNRRFATVDDLATKTRSADEDADFTFGRLNAAFATGGPAIAGRQPGGTALTCVVP